MGFSLVHFFARCWTVAALDVLVGCVLTMLLPYHDHEVDLNGNGKVSSAEATEIFAAMVVSTQVG